MMNDSTFPTLADELLMLLAESADYHIQPEVKAVLAEGMAVVRRLRKRWELGSGACVLALVGLSNVGKSTLVNALIGDEYSPPENGPATALPIEFRYGEIPTVRLEQADRLRDRVWKCANAAAVRQRLLVLLAELAGADPVGRSRLTVEVPAPVLADNLVLVDTPGFGAGQLGIAAGSHEDSLRKYLHANDPQVFWVVLADQGISGREKAFHQALLADVCDDLVITGAEEWDHHDRVRFQERFAEVFTAQLPVFHFVSGLVGLRARREGAPDRLARSGIPMLENRMRIFANPATRSMVLQEHLVQFAHDLVVWLRRFRQRQKLQRPTLWRWDSYLRWQAVLPGHALKLQLEQHLQEGQSCRAWP
jgi:hypothetical protein